MASTFYGAVKKIMSGQIGLLQVNAIFENQLLMIGSKILWNCTCILNSYKPKVSRDILRLKYNFRKALTPLWQLHVNVNLVQYIMYALWFHEMNILCFDQILSTVGTIHKIRQHLFPDVLHPLPLQCKQYFTAKFWSIFDPSPWHCLRQNRHWKLGQQTPSVGTILAYLETTA